MPRMIISLLMFFMPFITHAESPQHTLVFSGVVLEQGNNALAERFTKWLSVQVNYPLLTQYAESYQSLSDSLREHPESLGWTCGIPFIQDYNSDGQQLVAVPLFHGKPTYHSLVVTRVGRQEKTLADFEGKVFAYSDARSNSGFIAPSYALKQQEIKIQSYFRYLMHTGLHEYSLEALLAGQADVANIDEYVLVEYFKAHPEAKAKLVVLEKFGPFPFTPIVAGKQVSGKIIQRLQQALLGMSEDPEGIKILKHLGLDGFVLKPPSFYQPLVDMLNAL
ncbi:MAG: PhnD/SsuA/transferrin family substrate-binding protein [Mariprofundaceae bacterium]|nr:PhnD/SsuA/transferrin family substrate-binding protein [Mariprofundaceae bacterium]